MLPGGHEGKLLGHIVALSCLSVSFPFKEGGTISRLCPVQEGLNLQLPGAPPAAASTQSFLLLTIKAIPLCLKCLVFADMVKGA